MSQQHESAGPGRQQVWRRWQIARPTMAYVTAVPALVAVILVVSMVALGVRAATLARTTSIFAATLMVVLMVVLFLGIAVVLAIYVRRALRVRRMFLELGPRGVVHHDGKGVRLIGWAEIDRLFEVPPVRQLGLQLRDGSAVTLTVPTKVNGDSEFQDARSMILGQLGGNQPPQP
jgi:hypothetical protein